MLRILDLKNRDEICMTEKLKKCLDSERNRVLTGFVILVLIFGLVFGMSVAGIFPANSEIDRREITTTDGGTAFLIYENGELLGVDVTGDGEIDDSSDDMSLWGSTKISDTHVGTEMLALDDNGEITFGDDQDISMVYDPEEQSIEWTGGDLDFDGHDIGNIGSIDTEVSISKDQPHVDVTHPDFGAVGDGETDDHQAIMDAIDYAVDNDINVVYFPSRVFGIEQEIYLNAEYNGLSLISDGGVLKVLDEDMYNTIQIVADEEGDVEDITIKGLEFDGNRDGLDNVGNCRGIFAWGDPINRPRRIYLENLRIHNYSGSGINLQSDDSIINNCMSYNNWGHGIGTRYGENVIITNVITHNNGGEGHGRYGIDISDDTENAVLSNFVTHNNENGMKMAGQADILTVTNGYFINNDNVGFRAMSPIKRLIIDNCESRGNGGSGFQFRNDEGGEARVGTISSISDGHDHERDGVYIDDPSDNFGELTFDYIKVRDAGRDGIRAYPDDITIKYLDISGCNERPARFYGDNVKVLGGRAYNNNHEYGYGIMLQYCENFLIKNVYIGDTRDPPTQTHGLTLLGSENVKVINCDFTDAEIPFGLDGLQDSDIVRDCVGFTTEAKGQATITSGSTSVTINHGLDREPSLGDISVTLGSGLGSASYWYIDSVDDSSFEIVVDSDPEQDVDFGWNIDAST